METYIKQPSESLPLAIDFTPWMDVGETISGYVIKLDDVIQTFPSAGVISNATLIDGYHVRVYTQNGTDGTDYKITTVVTTTNNNIYEYDFNLRVQVDAAGVVVNSNLSYVIRYNDVDSSIYIVPTDGSSWGRNLQYDVIISAGLTGISGLYSTESMISDYSFYFTTQYCPLFTTLNSIKTMVGPSANSLYDSAIYRMILLNSRQVVDLYNINHSTSYSYDYWGCTSENIPYQLRRYVECKTAYDILALIKAVNSAGGNQSKTLGDMTIKYGSGAPSSTANDAPSKLKELYNCWNEMLQSIKMVKVAVKGYFDESKNFSHPTREPQHNRIVRAVVRNKSNSPTGPWQNGGYYYQRFNIS